MFIIAEVLSNAPKSLHRNGSSRVTLLSICYIIYEDIKERSLVARERLSLERGRCRWGEAVLKV